MTQLTWDGTGNKEFELGVDRGVLYLPDEEGAYSTGIAWSGLTTVTESPSGADVTKKYADNIVYASLVAAEEFAGTIEAFTYPDEFAQCDGTATPTAGVGIGQQSRRSFGFAYRTKVGNDLEGQDAGYKLHLVYGALVAPSEKAYATVNDSPDMINFSWKFTTSPVAVTGFKPTALLTIDSTKVDATALAALEQELYGSQGADPRLPSPDEVLAYFTGTVTTAIPVAPTMDDETKVITIPSVTGVVYKVNGEVQTAGALPAITTDTVVTATPAEGYIFPKVTDSDWFFSAE